MFILDCFGHSLSLDRQAAADTTKVDSREEIEQWLRRAEAELRPE